MKAGAREPSHGAEQPPRRRMRLLTPSVLVPVGSLVVAGLLRLKVAAIEHPPIAFEIVLPVLVVGLVFVTVFVALRHAEAVAHRIGEPLGTLVLTISVTAIEASVIVSLMLYGENNPTLARESVFSTIMIVTTGVIGVCLTFGGWRHRYQDLKRQGTSSLLAIVIALSGLTLILPTYTPGPSGGAYSTAHLALISLLCVLLYGSFIFAQMTRHRGDFVDDPGPMQHTSPVASSGTVAASLALLLIGLVGIVLLAEYVAGDIERGLEALEVRQADAIVGAFIATLVLMPESVAAIKSSLRNELQHALNIALGSACATIGLTIPVIAAISVMTGRELTLGLDPGDVVLLALALTVSIVSFGTGRTSVMTGSVHLVIFVAYLLMIALP